MDQFPDRKHPAHWPVTERQNRSAIVFVTVCTNKRQKILAEPEAVSVILESWRDAGHWLVGRYVILPDHVHLFCAPASSEALGVRRWVAFWKSLTTRRWVSRGRRPIWQTDGWDTQLRIGESYSAKWDYVRNNPVRHRLVTRAENWPFQGELNPLLWHDE